MVALLATTCSFNTHADLPETTVVRPRITGPSPRGATYLDGLAVDYWDRLLGQHCNYRIFVVQDVNSCPGGTHTRYNGPDRDGPGRWTGRGNWFFETFNE